MDWYRVFKTINGRRYLYLQKTYREHGRVRTLNRYIGPFYGPIQAKPFKGFTILTTMLLDDLKGRSTVSKQYLLDATNRADLKQPERDLFRNLLKDEPDQIAVKDFANRVKTELLPLTREGSTGEAGPFNTQYEHITLPDDLRGPVANYSEHVYQSPIKTSAGDVHFSDNGGDYGFPNYFAHTRVEDLPNDKPFGVYDPGKSPAAQGMTDYGQTITNDNKMYRNNGTTRRVIEIQSDLFQKGRLDEEMPFKDYEEAYQESLSRGGDEYASKVSKAKNEIEARKLATQWMKEQESVSKLEPYRNTWWERIIREEVKQAAKDGKTKLQFPTGETAMKIEGLGQADIWYHNGANVLFPDELKVGEKISRGRGEDWIITDVLGGGRFKAVDKPTYEYYTQQYPDQWLRKKEEAAESFDISGDIDRNNPIYKFYERDVQRYLAKKYGGQVITDLHGVSWVEINIPSNAANDPIMAFSAT